MHLHVFQWNFIDSIRHNNVKYAQWGTKIIVWNSPTFTRNPDRYWGSKFVIKRSLHQFNQIQIRTRNGLGALVQNEEINSELQTLHRPSVVGPHPLTFDLANEAIIIFGLGTCDEYSTSRQLKCLRVEWNVTHIMRVRELYWQFCWYLVHSKPTTHRHYRLLRTRTSHRQLKLISRQCKINWIRLWTRSCCQKTAIFGAELPQTKYLTHASLIQMQRSDSNTGKEHVTCCALFW